jgi:hypothetical protein
MFFLAFICFFKKADTFGKSDPRCQVFWGGQLVHTTPAQPQTLDPVWRHERVNIRVSDDGRSAVPASAAEASGPGPGGGGGGLASGSVWAQGLVVEVHDMDFGSRGSFLGRAALSTEEVMSTPSYNHKKTRLARIR